VESLNRYINERLTAGTDKSAVPQPRKAGRLRQAGGAS
jgi:hypothetical protein